VYGDKDRIGQVITNFLSNAITYSADSTEIMVKTSATNQRVTLAVQDFGLGIAKEKQPYVFERFYRVAGTTERTHPGLGIGLYVSREIIKRQGGSIWVKSEKGKGSTFGFTLPLKEEA
jgi:signal transduction histidine kinase